MLHEIKTILPVALCCVSLVALGNENTQKQPTSKSQGPTITTKAGESYEDCKIKRIGPRTISVSHSNGIVQIPFAQLPQDIQEKYSRQRKVAVKRTMVNEFKARMNRINKDIDKRFRNIKHMKPGKTCVVRGNVVIANVVGPNDMLVKRVWYVKKNRKVSVSSPPGRPSGASVGTQRFWKTVFGQQSENYRIITTKVKKEKLFWVKGLPTANIVDGQKVKLPGTFEITGTKTYDTAIGGRKTVVLLEPFDKKKYLNTLKKEFEQKLKNYLEDL